MFFFLLSLFQGITLSQPMSYSYAAMQLRNFPADFSVFQDTLDNVLAGVQSYVFTELSLAPANPVFNISVDLYAEIAALRGREFQDADDFHSALANLFVQLRDAHTFYYKPEPWRGSSFSLPVRFSLAGKSSVRGYMVPSVAGDYPNAYGGETFVWPEDGAVVTTIDGEDALAHLRRFAEERVGVSKDPVTRLNLAANGRGNGLGYFALRSQGMFPIPNKEEVQIGVVLSNGTAVNVTAKWVGYLSNAFTALSLSSSARAELFTGRKLSAMDLLHEESLRFATRPAITVPLEAHARSGRTLPPWNSSAEASFKTLSDGTGVLKVATFMPTDRKAFISTIQESVLAHRKNGGNKDFLQR